MRLPHVIELRRIALQLAVQLPVDPHDAKIVVGFLKELTDWQAEVPVTNIAGRVVAGCLIAFAVGLGALSVGSAQAQTAAPAQPAIIASADAALANDLAAGATWTTQPTVTLAGPLTVLGTNSNGNGNSRCNNNGVGSGRQCPASP